MILSARNTVIRLLDELPAGSIVYIAGATGEPPLVAALLSEDRRPREGITFTGLWIPGVNETDYSALAPGALMRSSFVSPALRRAFETGLLHHVPLGHSRLYRALASRGAVALAIFQTSWPASDGTVSLGLAQDFTPAAIAAGALLVGVINPLMPDIADGYRIPLARFETLIEEESPFLNTIRLRLMTSRA